MKTQRTSNHVWISLHETNGYFIKRNSKLNEFKKKPNSRCALNTAKSTSVQVKPAKSLDESMNN